jgi:hypothetical protein
MSCGAWLHGKSQLHVRLKLRDLSLIHVGLWSPTPAPGRPFHSQFSLLSGKIYQVNKSREG